MESVCGEELGSEAGRGGGGRSPEIPAAAALYFSVRPLRSRQPDPQLSYHKRPHLKYPPGTIY
jgi:hypothetical protein